MRDVCDFFLLRMYRMLVLCQFRVSFHGLSSEHTIMKSTPYFEWARLAQSV